VSEIDDLRTEIAELKAELSSQGQLFRIHLKDHQLRLAVVENFLSLFNAKPWKPFSTNFLDWSEAEAERIKELETKAMKRMEEI
jgi:hypothetical protein